MSPEIPRQQNMFTGEWDDNRTPQQRQADEERAFRPMRQVPLFGQESLEQTAALPASNSDAPPVPAVLDDVPLIAQDDSPPDGLRSAVETDSEGEEYSKYASDERTAEAIYMELVQLAEDIAATIWIDPTYERRYEVAVEITILEARNVGLSESEIGLALQIGEMRGRLLKG